MNSEWASNRQGKTMIGPGSDRISVIDWLQEWKYSSIWNIDYDFSKYNRILMLKKRGGEFDENYQKCQELGLQLPREIMSGQVKWDLIF